MNLSCFGVGCGCGVGAGAGGGGSGPGPGGSGSPSTYLGFCVNTLIVTLNDPAILASPFPS